jgi:ATP-dependent helicase HrpA
LAVLPFRPYFGRVISDARIQELQSLLPKAMLSDWVRLGSRLIRLLRDHHHPSAHEAILNRLLTQARASVALREERRLNVPAIAYPLDLPITSRKDEIVAAIRGHQVVVISGETGSGKTTQLPKMCLEAGLGIEARIGCTQPRRVAALSISRRIADELNVSWSREVGCKIRFDDRSSDHTYIKLMTDGILLAETQRDPLLSDYNAIIVDEAHERSLNIDFLLGYLNGLLQKRPELKLIITSATIDTQAFSKAFGNAPIIEVSGRLYPVEVVYAPYDAASEEIGDATYIDAATTAAERVSRMPGAGDVLIFMPGERDIRETSDLLEGRLGTEAEVIPLFGRLSSGDQQRIFAPSSRRKIIVSTNIAETSLTVPGIRYVIDSGLARMSRYNPRTRTKRLPVEPISQSSANQRKGRSGRMQDGVCVRLYSEEDFAARPAYTQPEIQRANLAEVILRMKAFRLGEIETFPFINPPPPAAIQGGYKLLQELGALDEARELTPLGRHLARLPIDPTLGRMLLQSQREHATRELLIIAAGLSIQDPRERPLEQKDAAASAHKRFADPRSDFLALLNIWNAAHDQWETLRTQNQRRKFCKANFLSYVRMREWQDLYAQLHSALEDLEERNVLKLNESNAAYEAIHRSILSGLLGHVATVHERNTYKGAGNRQLGIFPGSVLYDRTEKIRKAKGERSVPTQKKPAATHQPEWIVAGEIVETSQLFARTVAGIDPLWIVELAPHLCKVVYDNPHWSVEDGRVLAVEKSTLYGLEVRKRRVAYGNVDPKAATAIFLRSALVEDNLLPQPTEDERGAIRERPAMPCAYTFLDHNRQVRQKVETWQTRVRRHDLGDLDDLLYAFYSKYIENASSTADLNRLLRENSDPNFLRISEADLTDGKELSYDAEAFPDRISIQGQPVALSYAYAPGEEQDGVTVKLGFALAQSVAPASVEWAVPGLREAQVAELLRSLPKSIRKSLMPLPEKVMEITRDFRPTGQYLKLDLGRFIQQRFGVEIPGSVWPAEPIPQHLRPRIEIVGTDQKLLGAGRDLGQLRSALEKGKIKPFEDSQDWERAKHKWERFGLTRWNIGDLPQRVRISESSDVPVYGWPGLQVEDETVSLRLFQTRAAAQRASLPGIQRLVELALQKELAWMQKDLRGLAQFASEPGFGSADELQETAFANLRRHLLPSEPFEPMAESNFKSAVEHVTRNLPGLATQLIERVDTIMKLRKELLLLDERAGRKSDGGERKQSGDPQGSALPNPFAGLRSSPKSGNPRSSLIAKELDALLPRRFLASIPFERLVHIPRYLKALRMRAERAAINPLKDQERARQLAPYQQVLQKFRNTPSDETGERARLQIEDFRWMIEEFKVSLFAQELGTAQPISPKRLDQQLELIRATHD